jgi:hypothetical protein
MLKGIGWVILTFLATSMPCGTQSYTAMLVVLWAWIQSNQYIVSLEAFAFIELCIRLAPFNPGRTSNH